jgi:hypothetical protein
MVTTHVAVRFFPSESFSLVVAVILALPAATPVTTPFSSTVATFSSDVVHVTPESDSFLHDLDQDPQWELKEVLQSGTENDIAYEMCLYKRIK